MAGEGAAAGRPVVLFGAFDRHNFGDLLFAHVAQALLPGRELRFAGLAERDLRAFGGHAVDALPAIAAGLAGRPATVLHAGGEILSCNAWEAAAMLLPAQDAPRTIAYLEARPARRRAWVRRTLGLRSRAPYLAPRALFAAGSSFVYDAVGGVALGGCPTAMRAEVLGRLADADFVAVRDARTRGQLEAAGIAAALMPDPAVTVAVLFGDRIRDHGASGEAAELRRAFPRGYLAVQIGAEFGDDATLALLAGQLARVSADSGLGIVLFRAGAAPWHDDLDALRRLAARMDGTPSAVFTSLQLWDICALLAGSRGYCGSSLHGRIVAMAFGLPRLGLEPMRSGGPAGSTDSARSPGAAGPTGPAGGAGKQAAFVVTWEEAGLPGVVQPGEVAQAMAAALAADPAHLSRTARCLAAAYLEGFEAIRAIVDAGPGTGPGRQGTASSA